METHKSVVFSIQVVHRHPGQSQLVHNRRADDYTHPILSSRGV